MVVRARAPRRRGAAVAAVIMVLAAVNLAVLCSIDLGSWGSESAALRVESLRAFHAAESAALAAAECLASGQEAPTAGSVLPLTAAEATLVEMPPDGAAGEVVAEGRAGAARRRTSLMLE